MARSKGIAPRSVKNDNSKEPSPTVSGTGKDYGRAAVNAATGADDPKVGGQLMPGAKLSPRGKNVAGVASVGSPEKCISECLKSGKTDF